MKEKTIRIGMVGILDGLFLTFSLYISAILTQNNSVIIPQFSNFLIIALTIKFGLLFITNTYNTLWRYASVEEMFKISLANVISNFLTFFILNLINPQLTTGFAIVNCILDTAFTGGIRISYRAARRFKNYNIPADGKNVLIVGAGDAGVSVLREYRGNPRIEDKIIGFIDDDVLKQGTYINGYKVLGELSELDKLVKEHRVQEIIIAMPSVEPDTIREIVNECKKTKCKTKIVPSLSNLIDSKDLTKQIREVEIEDLLGRDPINLNNIEICGYLKDKRVLVTGGGGSIGSELCRQIANFDPAELIILDIYENNAYDLQNELKRKMPHLNLKVLIGSVRDEDRMEQIFRKYRPQVVFHAAAHKHVPLMEDSPREAIKNNVLGTLNTAQTADKYHVEKFVLISTDKAVNPTNIMGASKRLCEMIVQSINKASKTEFVAVRFGNVLGSNGSVIPLFKKQIASGGPVTVTHEKIIRYFMTIPEASQLVIQAGAMAKGGEIFILDMGEPVKIIDLARDLIRLSGFEPDVEISIEITGLRPGEKLYEELLLNEEGIANTTHSKILIGKPGDLDYKILLRNIALLKQALKDVNTDIKEVMTRVVPTYHPASNSNENMAAPVVQATEEISVTSENN
ncbi:FlaA1/EpsC-like NDP-sugar epimerase [Alkalibaculum bacchi]|uniref:FlaA1/EpsC-like NDP-sugar epimerase n=1 Tax=Alkalibaculum bacchi TaxID=645887 RepID=A0A366HY50_9FIRM|nr:nucleoside-diphosphate sugar epimerase/dehydratase [Alkalibaculum bacchi]RBP58073.1 FlaA1/EpsC-like NDP-sugar epimerase [Alkalibaculum bacchi]